MRPPACLPAALCLLLAACQADAGPAGPHPATGEAEGDTEPGDGEPSDGHPDLGDGDPGEDGHEAIPELALPLTIDNVVAHARTHHITRADDLVAALPRLVRQNYVLMEQSRSRHLATLERPRLILFTPTARFLIGVSSHEADPLGNTVELAELSDETGMWRFEALDLSTFTRTGGDAVCGPCHGVPTQPIWGAYPEWPGALGDEGGVLSPAQFDALSRLATPGEARGPFRSVIFELDAMLHSFALPQRAYAYPNTVMNFELGRAVARGLWRRLRAHPDYEQTALELTYATVCRDLAYDQYDPDEIVRAAGIEPRQFYLQEPYPVPLEARIGYDRGWNQGTAGLLELTVFLLLDDLLAARPALRALFVDVEPTRAAIMNNGFRMSDAAWAAEAARPDGFAYLDVLRDVLWPVFEGDGERPACTALAAEL